MCIRNTARCWQKGNTTRGQQNTRTTEQQGRARQRGDDWRDKSQNLVSCWQLSDQHVTGTGPIWSDERNELSNELSPGAPPPSPALFWGITVVSAGWSRWVPVWMLLNVNTLEFGSEPREFLYDWLVQKDRW